MTFAERIDAARKRLHRRKANRERKRRQHQGGKARREARAVRALRRAIRHLVAIVNAPRQMYDSVTISEIPSGAEAVAGYVNGHYHTFPSLKALFPRARKVSIAVSADADAKVLDIERGNAVPDEAPGWFRRHDHKRYGTPVFYTMASQVEAVEDALAAVGIERREYIVWSSHVGAGKHLCGPRTCGYGHRQAEATQWTWTALGRNLDESVLTPAFWA